MTPEQLNAAARELCKYDDIDSDSFDYSHGWRKMMHRAEEEIKRHLFIAESIHKHSQETTEKQP